MKKISTVVLAILFVMVLAPFATAAEQAAAASGGIDAKTIFLCCSIIAAALVLGLGATGAGLGMGQATSGSANAVGRNPEAQGKVMLTMMVGMAMTESIAIYALVISLLILYANPFLKYFGL